MFVPILSEIIRLEKILLHMILQWHFVYVSIIYLFNNLNVFYTLVQTWIYMHTFYTLYIYVHKTWKTLKLTFLESLNFVLHQRSIINNFTRIILTRWKMKLQSILSFHFLRNQGPIIANQMKAPPMTYLLPFDYWPKKNLGSCVVTVVNHLIIRLLPRRNSNSSQL